MIWDWLKKKTTLLGETLSELKRRGNALKQKDVTAAGWSRTARVTAADVYVKVYAEAPLNWTELRLRWQLWMKVMSDCFDDWILHEDTWWLIEACFYDRRKVEKRLSWTKRSLLLFEPTWQRATKTTRAPTLIILTFAFSLFDQKGSRLDFWNLLLDIFSFYFYIRSGNTSI